MSPTEKKGIKIAAQNRKAFHDYFVEDRYEAGIELAGTEVKSIRAGTLNLKDAYCTGVIPFKMEKTYGMFTVAKGLPLREEAKSVLTKAEQEEVKNHAGKWMLTETAEHTVEPYYDILLEKREALSDCTRVVLVGSQPGMRQPVALGMDDETARIWISLGYQYPVMEKIPETQNVESGVYSCTGRKRTASSQFLQHRRTDTR